MDANGNGVLHAPHTIHLHFDPQTHNVSLEFKPKEFATWDYLIGMLHTAIETAHDLKKQAQMQAMQQQMAQQQASALEAQAIKEIQGISRQHRR